MPWRRFPQRVTANFRQAPTNFSAGKFLQKQGALRPGKGLRLDLSHGPAAVRHLEIQLDRRQLATNAAALRSLVLALSFDSEPTVWCPVGDFFCSADALHPFETATRSATEDGRLICRWVMPFRKGATISLTNLGPNPLTATLSARTGAWRWTTNSMHFHANWRPDDVMPGYPPSDWNFIDIRGRGVLVGDAWTVVNIQGGWWGEGDEKIYVDDDYDGAKFPSHFGTGTEDYYGWAGGVVPTRTDEFSTPLDNRVRCLLRSLWVTAQVCPLPPSGTLSHPMGEGWGEGEFVSHPVDS